MNSGNLRTNILNNFSLPEEENIQCSTPDWRRVAISKMSVCYYMVQVEVVVQPKSERSIDFVPTNISRA